MCHGCADDPILSARCHGQRAQALRRCYLFEPLGEVAFAELLTHTRERDLAAEQWLCLFGEPADELHLVLTGELALLRQSAEGEEFIVALVGSGELFGEDLAWLPEATHPLSARALVATRVAAIDRRHVHRLLDRETAMMRALLATLHRRNAILLDEIEQVTVRSASDRLLAFLRSQPPTAQPAGSPGRRLSKRNLAARLSIRPETLSRVIRDLKERHLLDEENGRLVALAPCGAAEPCEDCPARVWGCPGPERAAAERNPSGENHTVRT